MVLRLEKLVKSKRRKIIAGTFLWVKSFKTRLGTKKILKFNGLSWTFCSSCVGKNVLSARAVCFRVHYDQNFYICPKIMRHFFILEILLSHSTRVSVQGVKSLGGHFACLCQEFEFYEVNFFLLLFFKKKMEILLHF